MAETGCEADAIDVYIFDRLSSVPALVTAISTAGGVLKAFSRVAPREVAFATPDFPNPDIITKEPVQPPYIVWSLLSALDRNARGRARIFTRPLVQVRAVTTGWDLTTVQALATLIDQAMHNAPPDVPVPGKQVMGFDRQSIVDFTEVVDGTRWNYLGGTYRGFICRSG